MATFKPGKILPATAFNVVTIERIINLLPAALIIYQARIFQDRQMLGNRGLGKMEHINQLAHATILLLQKRKDMLAPLI